MDRHTNENYSRKIRTMDLHPMKLSSGGQMDAQTDGHVDVSMLSNVLSACYAVDNTLIEYCS